MSDLMHPETVVANLKDASRFLSSAHAMAGEFEGDQWSLNGPWRDAIFGLNTAVEALAALIETFYAPSGERKDEGRATDEAERDR